MLQLRLCNVETTSRGAIAILATGTSCFHKDPLLLYYRDTRLSSMEHEAMEVEEEEGVLPSCAPLL